MKKTDQKLIIEISDPSDEAADAIKARLDFHQNIIYAVLVVVGVGFIAVIIAVFVIFIDHENYATEKYEKYINLVETESEKLKVLKSESATPAPKESSQKPDEKKPNTVKEN
jgi:hypothetical protein